MRRAHLVLTRIASLRQRITDAENNRKKILALIHLSKERCTNREITYGEYEESLSKKYQEKTLPEWVEYYDSEIRHCHELIAETQKKHTIHRTTTLALSSLFVIALFFFAANMQQNLTGFAIQEGTQSYNDSINQQFGTNTVFDWTPQHAGQLSSVSLSGSIIGNGTVDVYLNGLLITHQDSTQQLTQTQSQQTTVTGFAIDSGDSASSSTDSSSSQSSSQSSAPADSSSSSQPSAPTASATDSASSSSSSSDQTSSSPNSQPTDSGAASQNSPSQGESPAGQVDNSQQTAAADTGSQSSASQSSVTQDNTSSQQPEAAQQNQSQTVGQEQTTTLQNITAPADNTTTAEISNITQNNTVPPAVINEANATSVSTPENITAPAGIPEQTQQNYSLSFAFAGACTDTCSLLDKNLSNQSYTIKIVVSGVSFNFDSINYDVYTPAVNITQPVNETNVTIVNETTLNTTTTLLEPIEINKLVKWRTHVSLAIPGAADVNVSALATNISVQRSRAGRFENATFATNIVNKRALIGKGIQQAQQEQSSGTNEIQITDNSSEYNIDYETPAPVTSENIITDKDKQVFVSAPSELNYTDILTSSNISESLGLKDSSKIKLYWYVNGSRVDYPFQALDTDGNGIIDELQWITPHLSNQTFEIIVITKAAHLDGNRSFISDIYDSVKALDGNWSETIPDGDYVRVTFTRPLTNKNDVTIYPRIISGAPSIEVYEADQNNTIANFTNMISNSYNKVLLTNLPDNYSQDTFDLHVTNGSVQFDHIVDPTQFNYVNVQRGTATLTAVVSYVNLPVTVNDSAAFIIISPRSSSSTANILHVRAWLNSTTIRFDKYSTTSTTVDWQVVEGLNFLVQRGTLNTSATSTSSMSATLAKPVNITNTFLIITGSMSSSTASQNARDFWMGELKGSSLVNVTRGTTGTHANVTWQAVSWDGAYVQNGSVNAVAGSTTAPTTSALGKGVNLADSFLIFSQSAITGTNANDTLAQGWFSNSNTLAFHRVGATGTLRLRYFAVEAPASTVQKGTVSFAAASNNQNITSVNSSRAFTLAQFDYGGTGGTNFANAFVSHNLTNSTRLQLSRGSATGNTNGTWYIVDIENVTIPDSTPPQVTINSPLNGSYGNYTFGAAHDLPLTFNFTLNEPGSVMYSIDGGVTNISMNTTDGLTFTDVQSFLDDNGSALLGDYTANIYANDTAGNENYTESFNFTIVQNNIILNGTVTDANGNAINSTVTVSSEITNNTIYSDTGDNLSTIVPLNDSYDIQISPLDIQSVDNVEFHDVNFTQEGTVSTDIVHISENDSVENYSNVFSIDPQIENFSSVDVTFTAQTNALYKCTDWNFTEQACEGSWALRMKDLTPGQQYTFTMTSQSPAYGMINITNADHLDENLSFISNIYDYVKALDNNWSETIPDGDYVRVRFQVPLTNVNDIKLYPRIISGTPAIDVYEVNQNQTIARFGNIQSNQYNDVLLTNLTDYQDTFDLHVTGGSLQFDHIVDPTAFTNLSVQRGTATMTATTASIVIQPVNTSNSFILLSARSASTAGPSMLGVTAKFDDASHLNLSHYSTTSTIVEWQVVSGDRFYVQRGEATTGAAAAKTLAVNFTAINTSASFPIIRARMNTGTAASMVGNLWSGEIVNKTQLNLTRGSTGATISTVDWQIVQWENATVQNGTISASSTPGTQTIAAINTSDTFLIISYAVNASVNASNATVQAWFPSTTTVAAKVSETTVAARPVTVKYYAVSAPAANVQTGNTVIAASAAAYTANITYSNTSYTFLLNSYDYNTANTLWANVFTTINQTNATQLMFQKGGTTGNTNNTWYAVQLAQISDVNAPQVSLATPANATNTTLGIISFNATLQDNFALKNATVYLWNVTNSGVANFSNMTVTGRNNASNITVTIPFNGRFLWNTLACDNSANCAVDPQNHTITYDTAVPNNVTFTSPTETNGSNLSRNYILVNVSANDSLSGIASINISLYNTTAINGSVTTTTSPNYVNFSNLPDNTYYVNVTAKDYVGNTNYSYTLTINIDTTPPAINITYPLNITYNTNVSMLNYTAKNSNLAYCWYSLNLGVTNSSPAASCGINWTNLLSNQGSNTWIFWANDSAGNINKTNVTFFEDTINPQIQFGAQTETNNTSLSRTNIVVNITANDTNLVNITLFLYNATDLVQNVTTISSPDYYNFTSLPAGQYRFNASAYDTVNNANYTGTYNITLISSNNAPVITAVFPLYPTITPVEASVNYTLINFSVSDADGYTNLADATAKINFSRGGEATRTNTSCIRYQQGGNNANYSCTLDLWYFDSAGVWNITATINDSTNLNSINSTDNLTYSQLTAFVMGPSKITFSSITPGAINTTVSSGPIILNNTGNYQVSAGNIQINATDLKGETSSANALYAGNFTVGTTTGGSPPAECGSSTSTFMSHLAYTSVSGAALTKGNFTVNSGSTGQEQLYLCLTKAGTELPAQAYSTSNEGSWTIKILVVGLVLRRKRRNRKLKDDRLFKAIMLLTEEIQIKHSLTKTELVQQLMRELAEKSGLNISELKEAVEETSRIEIPVSIFRKDLGGLEALCKYLKENLGLSYSEIANAIDRNEKTVWTACKKASQKHPALLRPAGDSQNILLEKFKSSGLTPLETAINALREIGLKYSEIARILHRDQRNVWTIYDRLLKRSGKISSTGQR